MKKIVAVFFIALFPYLLFSQSSWELDNVNGRAFIENKGQFDKRNWLNDEIEYAVDNDGFYVFFTKNGLSYRFDKMIRDKEEGKSNKEKSHEPGWKNISELVNITWIGANQNVEIIPLNLVDNYYSYDIIDYSTDEINSVNYIKGYQKLIYKNLYDNIDVVYEVFPMKGIKYTILLHPGADLSQVQMKYSSGHTTRGGEFVNYSLNSDGNIQINTSLSSLIEKDLKTFYENGTPITSNYVFANDILSFNLSNYDTLKEVIIDPWIVSESSNGALSSSAVWEVETDVAGNIYTISNETKMQLKKYNSAGVIQWTHNTPWDTAGVWLGTLATHSTGTSYITAGTSPGIQRVDNAGSVVWTNNSPSGTAFATEFWSITFNCDKSKLLVGGTWGSGLFPPYNPAIYDIDINTGNSLSHYLFPISGGMFNFAEIRGLCAAKNAKFIFQTHHGVGLINQNFGMCPNPQPVFLTDNTHHYAYKCENYLPQNQNGGGLKAVIASDLYFYTHTGDKIYKHSYVDGSVITSVALPGGASSSSLGIVVKDCGLDIDACGNVYAGSSGQVVKFDQDLNVISSAPVGFTVYDVDVNNNGEVIAVGAVSNNSAVNRNGKIQAINMTACPQFVPNCCDANICHVDPVCDYDPAFNLLASVGGGTWSGTGITDPVNGTFDPSVSGVGLFMVYYTLLCGVDSTLIQVNPCVPITVCYDGTDYVASGGNAIPLTWSDWETVSYAINNEQDCIDCPAATPSYFFGIYTGCDLATCTGSDWNQIATGYTLDPTTIVGWPIFVTDGIDTVFFNNAGEIANCPVLPIELLNFHGQHSPSSNLLKWETATETNNNYFSIERSEDGHNWLSIAIIDGGENSSSSIQYSYVDNLQKDIAYYYRLKQVDFDGQFSFSKVIYLDPNNMIDFKLYPNPCDGSVTVEANEILRVEVMDYCGRLVMIEEVNKKNTYNFNLSTNPKGVYLVKIFTSDGVAFDNLILK